MKAPQIIWIAGTCAALLISAWNNAKTNNKKALTKDVIAIILANSILLWGGFFA